MRTFPSILILTCFRSYLLTRGSLIRISDFAHRDIRAGQPLFDNHRLYTRRFANLDAILSCISGTNSGGTVHVLDAHGSVSVEQLQHPLQVKAGPMRLLDLFRLLL
jgi:hypothetical protein